MRPSRTAKPYVKARVEPTRLVFVTGGLESFRQNLGYSEESRSKGKREGMGFLHVNVREGII